MYVICVYDVNEKRGVKVLNTLRKYLYHVQNSVFEGELSPALFKQLQSELNQIIQEHEDHIKFYYCYNNKQVYQIESGKKTSIHNIIS